MERVATWLLDPFVDPASRTYWASLLVAGGIAGLLWLVSRRRFFGPSLGDTLRHPSSLLDVQLLVARQLLRGLGALPVIGAGFGLATWLVRRLDATFGVPDLQAPAWVVVPLYTAVLFIVWDASRYVLHRLMHEVPALWALHQVHHSAEVMTPLTFHRIHPLESLLYGLRGWLVTAVVAAGFFWAFRDTATIWTLAGVHGVGFLFNAAFGNLRHSHVWISFGWLERIFVSPAQHQLHHAVGQDRWNYGTWLSMWDQLGGTFAPAVTPPQRLGLVTPNHDHTLWSAWFSPLASWVRPGVQGATAAVAFLLTSTTAFGAPPDPEETDAEAAEPDARMIVRAEWETPGSVNVVDEAQLARFERDDIGAVLGNVPGVTIREEDGFGLRPNIGIRGVSSDRSSKITLLEDGVLLGPAPYSAPAAYYFPMVTRVTGVEVSKGPAAIQNGPSTVGGAINLLSRDLPEGPAAAIDLAVGLRRTGKVHAWTGTQGEHFGFIVEGVGLRTDGFKVLDDGGRTGFDRGEVQLKARWRSASSGSRTQAIELKLGYSAERSFETYLGLQVADYANDPYRRYAATSEALMRWRRLLAELRIPVRIDNVRIETTAYHHDLERAWTKFNRFDNGPDVHALLANPVGGTNAVFLAILRGEEDTTIDGQRLLIGTNDRSFLSSGVQSKLTVQHTLGRATSRFEAGLRLHADQITRFHTEDPFNMIDGQLVRDDEETDVIEDTTSWARAIAGYVHEDLIAGRWHFVPGVRVESIWTRRELAANPDWTHQLGVLPGVGLLYDVTPSTAVFLGLHRGFSPVAPGSPQGTSPESSWNTEGGLRWRGPKSSFSALAYVNDYINLTGQCSFSAGCVVDAIDQQFNAGRVWVYGAEVEAEHVVSLSPTLELPLRATYTWTEGRFRTAFESGFPQFGVVSIGDYLPYVARHQASAQVGLRHRRFDVAASVRTRSPMLDAAGPFDRPEIPALTVLDVAANVAISRNLSVYATGSNLTNASPLVSLRPFGARPPAPLQVMVGVKAATGQSTR
ncbi:MAG: TonB-dependent receptor [Myxococcota bacterium]